MYDYIIVGSGFSGALVAGRWSKKGRSFLVLERRDHIGGNCISYDNAETNINLHRYTTHVNNKQALDYVNQFRSSIVATMGC